MPSVKRVAVLGSTGSIGTQALDIIAQFPDRLRVTAMAAKRNGEALQEQAARFGVPRLSLFDGPKNGPIPSGMESLLQMVESDDIDIVLVAVAGVIGLLPTLRAIQAGKMIALASKEVLVSAGEHVMAEVRRCGVVLTPVDSEHSALFQCLQGYRSDQVSRLILTASGGPFRGKKREELSQVTVEDALNHPTWRMGGKITIDSATLMNKALELIEARWLFDVEQSQIDVCVHPQSVVHSMVQFKDGSVLGQLGFPDMRLPIAYALLYPERLRNHLPTWDPTSTPKLTFESLDHETFPSIELAKRALAAGGTLPAIFNAANEEAANAFLRGEIRFLDIFKVVDRTVANFTPVEASLEAVLDADDQSRRFVRNLMQGINA
jgi:1-deoxy-D-xylulose-5-phosphate reductoisomerase